MLLGASNSWFPKTLSSLALPVKSGENTAEIVDEHWAILMGVGSRDQIDIYMKANPTLNTALGPLNLDHVWETIESRKDSVTLIDAIDLLKPEWDLLSNPGSAPQSNEFRIRDEGSIGAYTKELTRVVSVDRLRQVIALVGFTRIADSDSGVADDVASSMIAPLDSKNQPTWVPASEVRGEGIFIQLNEVAVAEWEAAAENTSRINSLKNSHENWRKQRGITPADADWPGARYVLVHSLSHALINQVALDSGYAAASIRERIYVRTSDDPSQAMCGVLLYTAAPDSEGTLGGLVSLAKTAAFDRIITNTIERMQLCSAHPFCAEHEASSEESVLHSAACHACLFIPETSCERGNRYLDRAVLCDTMAILDINPFFRES